MRDPDPVDRVAGQRPRWELQVVLVGGVRARLVDHALTLEHRGGRYENSFWSFIAAPMSPLILSLPVM